MRHRQPDSKTDRQTERQTDRRTDRQTDRQTAVESCRLVGAPEIEYWGFMPSVMKHP